MEEYERIASEEINRQWNAGKNPAIHNGYKYHRSRIRSTEGLDLDNISPTALRNIFIVCLGVMIILIATLSYF